MKIGLVNGHELCLRSITGISGEFTRNEFGIRFQSGNTFYSKVTMPRSFAEVSAWLKGIASEAEEAIRKAGKDLIEMGRQLEKTRDMLPGEDGFAPKEAQLKELRRQAAELQMKITKSLDIITRENDPAYTIPIENLRLREAWIEADVAGESLRHWIDDDDRQRYSFDRDSLVETARRLLVLENKDYLYEISSPQHVYDYFSQFTGRNVELRTQEGNVQRMDVRSISMTEDRQSIIIETVDPDGKVSMIPVTAKDKNMYARGKAVYTAVSTEPQAPRRKGRGI